MNKAISYEQNFSPEEFLNMTFILLKRKVNEIYKLTQEEQTNSIIKKRYEKTSEVLEALRLISTMIDFNSKNAIDLSNHYLNLQKLIFEGNHSNPSILKNIFG